MTIPEMLGQSGILTLLGMSVVFAFLVVLICFMKLTSFLVKSLGWGKEKAEDAAAAVVSVAPAEDQAVVAAIAAALAGFGMDNAVVAAIAAALAAKNKL